MTGKVAVAISAFRSEAAVTGLLTAIFSGPHPEVASVIVVDSLGSGAIPQAIARHGWPVVYENAGRNLGSAGNLARRLASARERGADWCLCLNHDASWSADRLSAMLAVARSRPRVGAVYPVLDHSPRRRRWEDGRRRFEPFTERLDGMPEQTRDPEVLWSSSNGALYATAPLAEGIRVMERLWMGYEDLAYGIALSQGRWKQLMCRDAVLSGIFDYRERAIHGRGIHVPDKPSWYQYYGIRNLILIRKAYGRGGVTLLSIGKSFARSAGRTLLFERGKVERLNLLLKGVFSGILGRDGKWVQP